MESFGQYRPESVTKRPNDFKEQVRVVYEKMFPEIINQNLEDREKMQTDVLERERALEAKDFFDALKGYGIDTSIIEITENNLLKISVKNHFSERRLPEGYAYKGGAARSLLLRNLRIDAKNIPRDVDVVRMVENEPNEGDDNRVSQEFMPEDFETGYGVEKMLDQDEYFESRDLTLNEVLATDEEIIATPTCVLDNVRRIIRITEYEKDENGRVNSKMLAKVLRLYAESIHKYGDAQIEGVDDWQFEEAFISPFWCALQLDRAFNINRQVAVEYIAQLKERRQIPLDIETPEQAAEYFLSSITGNFYYRHAELEKFELEDKWEEEFERLPKFEGSSRRSI